jgi:hypothetical protein
LLPVPINDGGHFEKDRTSDLAGRLGGHRDGQYEEQSQHAEHNDFLNKAAIKFV